MQLYFIRHAQSENNALWDLTGASVGRSMDPELTEPGKRQAEILARWLSEDKLQLSYSNDAEQIFPDLHNRRGYGLTHLYCSLMLRAVCTGRTLARALELPLLAWPDWHEGGGIYLEDEETGELKGQPGKPRSFFEKEFPELVIPDWLGEEGWWNRPFEVRSQRWERAQRVVEELTARHAESDDRVGIVSHGGFFNYFVKTLLGIDQMEGFWFLTNNASITRFDFDAGEVRMVYLNRVDHLPEELIT
jgi:2,3-bisphosphoglycerate-dependent phosphoglycerate mutase